MANRHLLAAALLGALALTGCTSESEAAMPSSPAPSPSPTPTVEALTTGSQLTQEQVIAAMPTVEQIAAGWTATEVPASSDPTAALPEDFTISPAECTPDLSVTDAPGVPAGAQIIADGSYLYSSPQNGDDPLSVTTLTTTITSYDTELDASALTDLRGRVMPCDTFDVTVSGLTGTAQVTPIELPARGDANSGFRMRMDILGMTVISDFAVIFDGHNAIAVSRSAFSDQDTSLITTTSDTLVDNLERVLAG